MPKEKSITSEMLESICKTLGEQNSETEIGNYLAQIGVTDTAPGITKWRRLFSAFANYQNINQESNKILIFI